MLSVLFFTFIIYRYILHLSFIFAFALEFISLDTAKSLDGILLHIISLTPSRFYILKPVFIP